MTRPRPQDARVYVGGYDLSGEVHQLSELGWDYSNDPMAALTWSVFGGLNEKATITTGTVNSIMRFESGTADSPHDWITGMGQTFQGVTIPIGQLAAPAAGDPTWQAMHYVKDAMYTPSTGMVTLTVDFAPTQFGNTSQTLISYDKPWGKLLHANSAATGANSSAGVDGGGATTAGGWMLCQFLAYGGTGSATVTVEDSADNSSFSAVTGLTTGAVAHTSMPSSVFAQTATTATIRQYTRWQVSLSTLTSVTFVLSLVRGR